MPKANRIWELDAFRGLCVLGMVLVHLVFDLVELYRIVDWSYPAAFSFVKDWGGVLFLLVSGICVTLGSHPVKRGILVFLCGLLCTAVTGGMYLLGMSGRAIIIWFGVLHCLGVCMLLWPLTKKLPTWALGALGLILVLVGLGIRDVRLETDILAPLGLYSRRFFSSDYFPLLPNLGWFLLGAVLGRTVYRKKETLLPRVNPRNVLVRILCWCGNKSLLIYLLHQPVLAGVFELVLLLRQ